MNWVLKGVYDVTDFLSARITKFYEEKSELIADVQSLIPGIVLKVKMRNYCLIIE